MIFLKINFIFVTGKDKTVEHAKLYINGMTCINCQTRIQNALTKHPGITQAAVSYETETADILYDSSVATVYKGNIIKNLIMDCQSYTKYRPNETTGGIFVSWRRKEELPTGA